MCAYKYSSIMSFQLLPQSLNRFNPELTGPFYPINKTMQGFSQKIYKNESPSKCSFLQLNTQGRLPFGLVWTFETKLEHQYLVTITPSDVHQTNQVLKADRQEQQAQFLQLLQSINRENRHWTIVLNPNNEIMAKITYLLEYKIFKDSIESLKQEAIATFQKISLILSTQQFRVSSKPSSLQLQSAECVLPFEEMGERQKIIEALFLLQTRKQQSQMFKESSNSQRKSIFQAIVQSKSKSVNQMSVAMNLLGQPQKLKWKISFSALNIREKQTFSTRQLNCLSQKNVKGVKIKEKVTNSQDKQVNSGSHCSLTIGLYKLFFVDTVYPDTLRYLSQSQPCVQKFVQLKLAEKRCKKMDKQPSVNSFLNQYRFIHSIKELSRNVYLPIFYVETEKVRVNPFTQKQIEEDQSILMDYYPFCLEQEINSKTKGLTFRQKLIILKQVVDGLCWLNYHGICHRDLKPDNIMLDKERVVKIIDFGSSCSAFDAPIKIYQPKDKRLLTTKLYSLPFSKESEALKKKKYSKDSYNQHPLFDCYSFGKMMEQMLSSSKSMKNYDFLSYLWQRCQSQLPEDRPEYLQLSCIFEQLIQTKN